MTVRPQSEPDLLVFAFRVIGHVHRQDLRLFLVRQSQQGLYLRELVKVLPLVKQNLAVAVVHYGLLYDRRGNDVIDFLRHHNRLSVKFADSLEKIADVVRHPFLGDSLPRFLYDDHLAHPFQTAHLVDKQLHDDDSRYRKRMGWSLI